MKILFTADWHIKLGAKNVPKDWQRNRFDILFNAVNDVEADLVIVGGDIFDKMPTLEELELYYKFVHQVNKETIIFDGNHEATKKGHTFLTILGDVTTMINNKVTIIDGVQKDYKGYGFDIIPYTHIKSFDPSDFSCSTLFTHVRGEIPPHVQPEIDLDKLNRWKTVYAGDLHSVSNCQRNIKYPGSPMTISFHRNEVDTGFFVFELGSVPEWHAIKMPQLLRKTIEAGETPVKDEFHHVIYEVTGNISELKDLNIDESLLDKKVVTTSTDVTLDLSNMTIQEELEEYLIEILGIQGEALEHVLGVFNDYSD